ncbi:hypothetical protein HA402_001245 [Bradysia odoriphaga]|nr:hypothetical protein HA402_001245 [Bradysia odoriphaga]
MGGRKIDLNATVLMIIALGFINNSQSVTYLSDYVKIAKCCPQDSELIAITDESGLKTEYQCNGTGQDDELNPIFFGYNLEISNESQIPSCDEVLLFDIDVDGELISSDSCIDMYQGGLHGLTCSELFKVEVHKVFKCCAEGFSYDIINRECVESLDVPKDFHRLFSKSVGIFQTDVPTCGSNEIFVEYETDIHNTKLIRSGLKLSAIESEILKPGMFCIDGIVNSESNKTMARHDNGIIVRTCRPKVLCAGMPCVRRCCSNEMMMQRLNGSIKCVPYGRNIKPTFYDIGSPVNGSARGYLEVEPTVYGLINTQTCNRYKLTDDPDDAHYISHVDGSLHVNHFEKPFSNDEYCVEFLDTGTVDMHTFVCFSPYPQTKFTYYAIGLTISCIFLALTLICYACLPKLLNLHGKTLVCHVISLLSAYISLAIVQFHTETRLELCYFVAYLIFFCFLAAFCWQSIMCFDIWWTFGSYITRNETHKGNAPIFAILPVCMGCSDYTDSINSFRGLLSFGAGHLESSNGSEKYVLVCARKLARSFHIFLISNWITHSHQCHTVHPYRHSL